MEMEMEIEMNMETMVVKTATPALGRVLVFVLLVDIYANLKKMRCFPVVFGNTHTSIHKMFINCFIALKSCWRQIELSAHKQLRLLPNQTWGRVS